MFTELEKNEKAEELVKRYEVRETPFTVIETEGKIFGTLGRYRITEPYEIDDNGTEAETLRNRVKEECKRITWDRIIQTMMIVLDQQEEIKNFIKEEE